MQKKFVSKRSKTNFKIIFIKPGQQVKFFSHVIGGEEGGGEDFMSRVSCPCPLNPYKKGVYPPAPYSPL